MPLTWNREKKKIVERTGKLRKPLKQRDTFEDKKRLVRGFLRAFFGKI